MFRKQNLLYRIQSAMLLLLNIHISYGEGIVFFFLSNKSLIGAKREGMLSVW